MTEKLDMEKVMEEDTQHGKYLTFALGQEIFGIEIRYVTEIIGIQTITEIPEVPAYVKGIINLRGKVIPVIDVRLKFKKDAVAYDDRTCIVVVDINQIPIGLIVDNVNEVMNISDEDIAPPPDARASFDNKYIKGIGKSEGAVQLLLDCEKLLMADELTAIEIL